MNEPPGIEPIKHFDVSFRHLTQESAIYWSRSQFFIVANAALIGFAANLMRPDQRSSIPTQAALILVLSLLGIGLTYLWGRVLQAGDRWFTFWENECITLETQAFGYSLLQKGRENTSTRKGAKINARYSWRAILAVWIVSLFYGCVLMRQGILSTKEPSTGENAQHSKSAAAELVPKDREAAAQTQSQAPASAGVVSKFAQTSAGWTTPFPAHRVIGNIHYVGSAGLAAFLTTTPKGHILINSDLESSVPQIRESVEKLGFKFTDIKILLISHAHFDHCAGSAKIKELTGAQYMVMDEDVPVVESGGKKDFQYGNLPEAAYLATKVDRVLHDGDEVKLGGVTLVAHKTAGHTRGCTTWTMKVRDDGGSGKMLDVVIVGSPNVNPGYKLAGNAAYPEIAKDYEHAFAVWKALPCDVFLGAHGSYYGLDEKFKQLNKGGANPFVDPAGYKSYVAEREAAFREELKKQEAAK